MSITTYTEAEQHLERGRSSDRHPLPGRYTQLERREGGRIAVRYHDTDVVTYRPDGVTVLDSGGWRTATTKERFNTYSLARIWQANGLWYAYIGQGSGPIRKGPSCLFVDGLKVDDNGRVLNPRPASEAAILERMKRRVDGRVRRYINGYAQHVKALGAVPEPEPGDCWYCLMRTEDGRSLRDATDNVDHLMSHIQERYYPAALLLSAAIERGYGGGPGMVKVLADADIVRGREPYHVKDALRAYFRRRKLAMAEIMAKGGKA